MKKRSFLLIIPFLCLASCNKAKVVTYRNNYTERVVETITDRGGVEDLKRELSTAKYDDNGLPIELTVTNSEHPDSVVTTFERKFDDKHREIKYYEHVSDPDIEKTRLINRTYDNDFLIKEEAKESHLKPDEKLTITTKKLYHKFANDKEGYSISALTIKCTEREVGGIIDNALPSIYISLDLSSYDKLERPTSSFTFIMNGTSFRKSSVIYSNIQYKSDANYSNDFYEIEYDVSSSSSTMIEGYETYSDKNLLLERKEVNGLQENTETYEYDDLDRITSSSISKKTMSKDGSVKEDTTNITNSYVKDYTLPIETIKHEIKHKKAVLMSTDSTITREFDDYGRALSANSVVVVKEIEESGSEKVTQTTTSSVTSKYGDPIVIPEDEEFIIEPVE